jgi:glycine/D-amino acid oxidase-like deaminating enzyme
MNDTLPVVVIGAGPVGLAAAAHLLRRGLVPRIFEAGDSVGAGMSTWSQVRMFSPWRYAIDAAARELLEAHGGWTAPDPEAFPTGREVVQHYLRPLAAVPSIAAALSTGARVTAVARQRRDRMKDAQRGDVPYLVRYRDARGEHELLARAVIDASGTIDSPNPLGASGIAARGERELQARIAYGMPDVLGAQRTRYAGKRVLVVGSGHSAFNVLQDLARLADEVPGTRILWALRRTSLARVLGGGDNDQLRERGRLGQTIGALVERGALQVATGFELERLEATADGIVAHDRERTLAPVDEIIGATGFRPRFDLLDEVRLSLDPGTQAPTALAPLIDPNLHSCGSVRPHGAEQLRHPDADLYIVGMKSYGRAPTFLLLTGYEQVRSVVAAIDGDWEAARRVELELPETGVCITSFGDEPAAAGAATCCGAAGSDIAIAPPEPLHAVVAAPQAAGCCGGPARQDASACCRKDEVAKANGESGCGCSAPATSTLPASAAAACCA